MTATEATSTTGLSLTRRPWKRISAPQLVLLGATTSIGALTIDLYLPAMPGMAREFGVSDAALQLTLTATVIGMALGQLMWGPVSDRLGRRMPLLAALAGYLVVTVVNATAASLPLLIAGRFVQGLLVAAALTICRAVVRDFVSGAALASAMAGLILVMGAGPIFAPSLGSLLLTVTGWRGVFVALAVFSGVLLAVLALTLPESLPRRDRRPLAPLALGRTYASLLVDRTFIAPALVSALSFMALFAYISAGSFVLQEHYGVSQTEYALVFGLTASCVIGGSQINARLMSRMGLLPVLRVAPRIGLGGAVVLLAVTLLGWATLPVLVGMLMATFLAVGMGLNAGATVALTGQPPHRAGLASGLVGVIQFALGAVAAPVVGLIGDGSATGMAVVMVVALSGAVAAGRLAQLGDGTA